MTELLERSETAEYELLTEATVGKAVKRLYDMNRVAYSYAHERRENPQLSDEEIVRKRTQEKLFVRSGQEVVRRQPDALWYLLAQEFLSGIEDTRDAVDTKDFALLYDIFGAIARTTHLLEQRTSRHRICRRTNQSVYCSY